MLNQRGTRLKLSFRPLAYKFITKYSINHHLDAQKKFLSFCRTFFSWSSHQLDISNKICLRFSTTVK